MSLVPGPLGFFGGGGSSFPAIGIEGKYVSIYQVDSGTGPDNIANITAGVQTGSWMDDNIFLPYNNNNITVTWHQTTHPLHVDTINQVYVYQNIQFVAPTFTSGTLTFAWSLDLFCLDGTIYIGWNNAGGVTINSGATHNTLPGTLPGASYSVGGAAITFDNVARGLKTSHAGFYVWRLNLAFQCANLQP